MLSIVTPGGTSATAHVSGTARRWPDMDTERPNARLTSLSYTWAMMGDGSTVRSTALYRIWATMPATDDILLR